MARLRSFPEIGRVELIRHFTLTDADEAFLRKFRTGRNVLGAAVQLCALPWLGYVPDDVSSAPAAAVGRLSQRLGVPMGELRDYGARSQTRTDHLREIAAYAGWRTTDAAEWKELDEFLFARAMEHDSPKLLLWSSLGRCGYSPMGKSRMVCQPLGPGVPAMSRTVLTVARIGRNPATASAASIKACFGASWPMVKCGTTSVCTPSYGGA